MEDSRSQKRALTYLALTVALFLGYFLLRDVHWQGNTQLHTLMEVIAALLALGIGALALVRFYSKANNTILFIGVGFLGTALLDGYHAIVTSSFFAGYFPSVPSSLIPWSWIASRFFLSVLLLFSWVAWRREVRLGEAGRISEKAVYWGVGSLALASLVFFIFVPLPRAYFPKLFFHRPEEFVPAIFFLWALAGYLHKGRWKNDTFEHWLVLSLIVGVMGQAVFMSFSGRLFDLMFDTAHTLKKVSYLFILTGLLVSMYHLFRQAGEAVDSLDRSARDLRKSKEGLEALTEASVQMTSALELQGVLRTIIDQSTHVVGADRCAVYLVDPKTANAQAVMTRGLSAEYLEETHHLWQKHIRSPEFEWGEMLIRMDAVNDPRQQPIRELVIREGIQSLLIVPLRRRGSVIGGVGFYFDETQDFEGERLSLCRAFANQTTTAIENSRAYAEIRVRSERQEALREVTRDLMENLDISEVFSRICKAVCELLDADSTRLFVLDEKSGALVKTESYGKLEGEENSIRKFPRGKGVLYRVVSSLRPVAVAEVLEDPEWMNREWAEKAGIKSFLGIPLILKDRAVGALNCYTTRRRDFLPDEIQLAQDFGDQAAIAIENSRLFSQAQQRATTLAILNEISSAINATLDLDELFRITAQQVKKVVPCNRASLFILDAKKQEIARFSAVDDVEERQPNLPPTNLKGTRFEKILRTLEPVYIPNTREDPHPRSRVLEAEGLRSVINVPIVIREECVGFLNVAAEAVDAFGDEHVQLLRWVADHLGAAIQNAKLYSQVRDTGERLDSIVRSASDGIITLDPEGRVTSWNPGAEAIYGYTQEEMLGGDISRLHSDPVRDQEQRDEIVNKIRSGESVPLIEKVRRRKDGTPVEVSIAYSAIKDSGGRVIGSSGINRDIGVQKRAEEALRKSEETYRTLFEQARDGIEIVDEEGRYVDCNQKACEMAGFTREEMVGKPVADFLDPKDRDSFSQRIDQILQADGLEIYESVNIRKDGVPVDFEISAGVIRLNGRKHALFFLRDITERKRAEEALRFTRFCLDHAGDAVFWVTYGRRDCLRQRGRFPAVGIHRGRDALHESLQFQPGISIRAMAGALGGSEAKELVHHRIPTHRQGRPDHPRRSHRQPPRVRRSGILCLIRPRHHRTPKSRADEKRVRLGGFPRAPHAADFSSGFARPSGGRGGGRSSPQRRTTAPDRRQQHRSTRSAHQRHPGPGKNRGWQNGASRRAVLGGGAHPPRHRGNAGVGRRASRKD